MISDRACVGAAGLLGLVYYSQPFSPPDRPTDPALAAEVAYSNAKAGVTALVLVFLGKWLSVCRPTYRTAAMPPSHSMCAPPECTGPGLAAA